MSLRSRILLLVFLATLTPAVLLGVYLFDERQTDIADAKQSLTALGGYAAEDLTNKVNGTVQLLFGLSRAPDLDALDGGNKVACSAFLGSVLSHYPQYTGLLTIRPDGQLHCDSLRSGRNLDLNDRAYFKRARTATDAVIEAAFGRLTGIAVLQIAYPARDQADALKFVLLASLNLEQFGSRITTASPYPETSVLIWDDKGTLMARLPDDGAKKLAGTSQLQSALYGFVRSGQSGETAELPGPDGVEKIWALSVLPPPIGGGLRMTLGIPRAVLVAKADHDLGRALAALASGTLLAVLAALWFAEVGIRRHLARITAAAARQGKGDFSARIGAPFPRGELGELMTTLDATAVSVQTQQLEIERNSDALRRSNRMLRMLSAINSTIVRVHDRDQLLAEACRIAADDGQFPIVWVGTFSRETQQIEPVCWQGVERSYFDQMPRRVDDQTTLVGEAFSSKHPIIVNDIAVETRAATRVAAQAAGSRTFAMFPLVVAGASVGILVLHARVAGFFDEAEVKLLNELAGDVAFALEYIEKSDRLEYLAHYDALTGIANRALFHERLTELFEVGAAPARKVALVVVDIERFRIINETFGREVGDELLRQIAARGSRSDSDLRSLARIGGDQFAFVGLDQVDAEAVVRDIQKWHASVFGEPFSVAGTELRVSARYGIALFPENGDDADTLFRNAEAALKKTKTGGERYLFYIPSMTERAAEKLALENRLRLAVANAEFVLHYQPTVDLSTGRIMGVEALLRWQNPELGLVSPAQFMPLLEESGLILQVSAWVLRQALRDHRDWREAGLNPPRVSVNVSPAQLHQVDFLPNLQRAVHNSNATDSLDIRITESLIMADVEENICRLAEIKASGVGVGIVEFGTGHSSLAYLAKLPVQSLKIHHSLIAAMLANAHTMKLVSTIISLAHSLRLTVIADSVETEDQAKMLRLLRCDQMQGTLFSEPLNKDEFALLMQRQRNN